MATRKRSNKKGLSSAQVDLLSTLLRKAIVKRSVPNDNQAAAETEALRKTLAGTLLQLFLSLARKEDLEMARDVIQDVLNGGGQGGPTNQGGPEEPERGEGG